MTVSLPLLSPACLLAFAWYLTGCGDTPSPNDRRATSVDEVIAFYRAQGKTVLTFIGFSAAGYEGTAAMLAEARKRGEVVTFVSADMNHERAIEKAKKKGLPTPTDFRGEAHAALTPR